MFAMMLEEELFLTDGNKNGKLLGREFAMPAYVRTIVDMLKKRTITMSDVAARLIDGLEAQWHAVC